MILSDIEQRIKEKIEAVGVPLKDWDISINRGILTGFNEAFIINKAKKDQLIAEDPNSAEIIRPILRGRDIKRYGYEFADLWLLNIHNGIPRKGIPRVDVDDYPAVKKHLNQYYEKLSKRYDKGDTPYNLRSCDYMDDFSKQKIIYAETMRVHKNIDRDRFPRFGYSTDVIYLDKTCFMLTGSDLLYILPILNSKLMNFIINKNIAVLDTGGFLMQKIYIEYLPLPNATNQIKKKLESLVLQIINNRKNNMNTYSLEEEIDLIVYDLFDFSKKEISFIASEKIVK